MSTHTQTIAALGALSTLLRTFSDAGLAELIAAGKADRLRRGVWHDGGIAAGCPLSCADGIAGMAGASRFVWQAADRDTFVRAWDRGIVTTADVVALASLEVERRATAAAERAARRDRVRRTVTGPLPRAGMPRLAAS